MYYINVQHDSTPTFIYDKFNTFQNTSFDSNMILSNILQNYNIEKNMVQWRQHYLHFINFHVYSDDSEV